MRLIRTLMVVLLAMTTAIFPISVPQAAVPAGHQHATAGAGPVDIQAHVHARSDAGHDHAGVPTPPDIRMAAGDHVRVQGSQDCNGPDCCSMSTCHAFHAGSLPAVHAPVAVHVRIAPAGSEQVEGVIAGGLDRPPRTV